MKKHHIPCGIECHFENETDPWKAMIWSGINFENRFFFCVDSIAFIKSKLVALPKTFRAELFQEMIDLSCSADRMVVHLYPEGAEPERIDDYSQYMSSQCEMVLLVYDSYYFEIYSKNINWLESIAQAAKTISGSKLIYKFEGEDSRSAMTV